MKMNVELLTESINEALDNEDIYIEEYERGCGGGSYEYHMVDINDLAEKIMQNYLAKSRETEINKLTES